MTKTLTAIFCLLFITSCSNNNKNEIPLFNNIVIKKATGESEKPLNQLISNSHKENLNYKSIQIPLYRYLNSKNYKIFIGLPYNTTIEKMIATELKNKTDNTIYFEQDSISFIKQIKKDDNYATTYVTKIEDNSIIYFCGVSKSKKTSDSLFNKVEFSKRIINKN
ncbi:hypothetical protein V6246_08135 [Algibacter sp. TI.3.09]|uniref:hypothetical protein n=1 Tax=Algibacter sp. TI.3.09 TaxID=3121298 RepID=UPI00311D3295